jgi:hypothetical protein
MAFDTLLAHAARYGRVNRHGLTLTQASHTRPECLDRSREFVAENERRGRHTRADVAVAVIVDIRAAQPNSSDAHQHLTYARLRFWEVVVLQRARPVQPY